MKERLYVQLRGDRSLIMLAKRCAGDKWEDVLQEIGIVICSKSDAELERLNTYFNFWCARTIINMSSSKGVVGRNRIQIDENADISEYAYENGDTEIEEIAAKANAILSRMHWYDSDLFKLYLEMGSLRKISAATSIPVTSIHHAINNVKNELRRQL